MTSLVSRKAHAIIRWAAVFTALTVTVASLLQAANIKPVFADDGGYPWIGATYVDASYDWGYNTCPSNDTGCMKLSGYLNGVKMGEADPWVYNLRNCTSYVAWKINQVFNANINGWGNAADWDNNATGPGHPYTNDSTPQVGDIAQWNATSSNAYGHVAYVYAVSGTTASLAEYNSGYPKNGSSFQWGLFYNGFTSSNYPAGAPSNYIHIATVPSFTPLNTFDWPNMTYINTDHLNDGQSLLANQYLLSQNGEFALKLTGNGNLAEYGGSSGSLPSNASTNPLWNNGVYSGSLTASSGGLAMQNDGNLVLYNGNGAVLWSTGTGGNSGDSLVVQNDGNVVLYSWSGVALWSTHTSGSFTASNTWTSTLADGHNLASCGMLTSADNRFHLLEECNGDLYEFGPGNSPMWHSNTDSNSGASLAMQNDGNLVMYTSGGTPIWSTNTGGNSGDSLVIQNDGNVVLYSWSGVPIWATNT